MPFLTSHSLRITASFLASGGASTLLHWSVMALLIYAGSSSALATACGAGLGAVANYLLQFHFTFSARARHRRALPRYVVVSAMAWLANLSIFIAIHQWSGLSTSATQGLTSLVVAGLNFYLYRKVVFHEHADASLV